MADFTVCGPKSATLFEIEDGGTTLKVAALIGGDGVDLVLQRAGHRSITVQLTIEAATKLAEALNAAAAESAEL